MKKFIPFLILISLVALSSCHKSEGGSDTGIGGSTARFTVKGNYLYTIGEDSLTVFDVTNASQPKYLNKQYVGSDMETIFPYNNSLLMGSRSGMYIYNLAEPTRPSFLSKYLHIVSCDPVVADGNYAYVTLRSSNNGWCRRGTNMMEVIDISNLTNPRRIATYDMYEPKGLGIDNNRLFVCDKGLKVYNATNPANILLEEHFQISANDVIVYNNLLMVVGEDGLYQYDYSGRNLSKLSFIRFY